MTPPAESHLDRMIARLTTQRVVLGHAAGLIADRPGPVLEVGLGKGRTFDHLRRLLPDRALFAFDAMVRAPEECVPPADRLFVGDFRDTLPAAAGRLPGAAVLAHADFGSRDAAHDEAQARWLGPLIRDLMASGGIVVSDRDLGRAGWTSLPCPETSGWRYHLWRLP
ncbi:MAG: class I SAM-dependent methyltransferase [Inquilinaceae bacterium]